MQEVPQNRWTRLRYAELQAKLDSFQRRIGGTFATLLPHGSTEFHDEPSKCGLQLAFDRVKRDTSSPQLFRQCAYLCTVELQSL